ncbi:MAG: DUF1015 domain-containing protein [Oscillospiraceae bacterium]|nr:DUF1015 domain-containing protein [Oscillospiraceae bacterium]
MENSIFRPADILIPKAADMRAWSVIACDQFTSEREYWDRVRSLVGDSPSTLNMIVPEAHLSDEPALDAARRASAAMEEYLAGDIFTLFRDSYIYVERTVTGGVRKGVVGMIDLEKYNFQYDAKTPVRSSERTVAERLPARMLIRDCAALELPHSLLLINDKEKSVIEPFGEKRASLPVVYDFDLMEGGGHITGRLIEGEAARELSERFDSLPGDLKFIVGDGNHSLAAAKELWNKLRAGLSPEEIENHPARFALCEVNNVYDNGIRFEPIHRIMFGIDPWKLYDEMREKLESPDGREVTVVIGGERVGKVRLKGRSFGKMVDIMQEVLEEYESVYEGTLDYIHDEESLIALTEAEESLGILMPTIEKRDLFETVSRDGVFPKKSFSIGHARDKRYYLECRKIR